MESKFLIPIGSQIIIDKSKIKTDLPQKSLANLPKIITANVIDYKMTDGNGVGYVLMTETKLKIWIFSNELDEESKRSYGIKDFPNSNSVNIKSLILNKYSENLQLETSYRISYLLNPLNFLKWTLYTFKDII